MTSHNGDNQEGGGRSIAPRYERWYYGNNRATSPGMKGGIVVKTGVGVGLPLMGCILTTAFVVVMQLQAAIVVVI